MKKTALSEKRIDQSRFSVIDVRNNGNVAYMIVLSHLQKKKKTCRPKPQVFFSKLFNQTAGINGNRHAAAAVKQIGSDNVQPEHIFVVFAAIEKRKTQTGVENGAVFGIQSGRMTSDLRPNKKSWQNRKSGKHNF